MIIVLDTNVLVSGLLKGNSKPGTIVRMVAAGKLKLAYDSRILNECAISIGKIKEINSC